MSMYHSFENIYNETKLLGINSEILFVFLQRFVVAVSPRYAHYTLILVRSRHMSAILYIGYSQQYVVRDGNNLRQHYTG
jgi:hypothetical protein